MMVEIVDVATPDDGDAVVEVTSELGRFRARWHGAAPALGARLAVELSFELHRFTWGVDAMAVDEQPHAITSGPGERIVLWARVEKLDEGGYLGLRLGPSIVMANADGDAPPVGATVRLEAPRVTLFDTNI